MNIELAVMHKYPHATPNSNFFVRKNKEKAYIYEWNLTEKKPSEEDLMNWWIDYKKQESLRALKNSVNQSITSSFTSIKTGHSYDFEEHDQSNMTQQMLLFVNNPTLNEVDWKTNDAGIVKHTREEFFAVVDDANNHKRSNLAKFWAKEFALKNATTVEEIEAITWEDSTT
jgi:hypothetical protein